MKLELKHLAPYLPYGLKLRIFARTQPYYDTELNCAFLGDMSGIKPILRPLSDLTKEIEVDGEAFIPVQKIEKLFTFPETNPVVMSDGTLTLGHWEEYQYLFKWHFDVFGLIEKGLAIDINTL